MKKNTVYSILSLFLSFAIAGCATGKPAMKATATSEVVTATGAAPIVNGETEGARNTSLHDALKNALGLVVGVYVSQEALVSKSMLIEDNITSQTDGYIERYDVIKQWIEGDFYKTQVKALVRKEDLSAKIKSMELEPKRLGNPVVTFAVDDLVDGNLAKTHYAEDSLKKYFVDQGFTASESSASDILISGRAEASFNTDQGLGGLISYRSALSVKAVKSGSGDVITSVSQTLGGVDVTKDAAAKAAIMASAGRSARTCLLQCSSILKSAPPCC